MQVASTDFFTPLQGFLLSMVGLSVACERVTETIKEIFNPTPPTPPADGTQQKQTDATQQKPATPLSRARIQLIAIISGVLVTALSTLDPLGIAHGVDKSAFWSDPKVYLNWLVTGILVSGGSAFWNHLLDILQATKVQKEQAAAQTVAAAAMAPGRSIGVALPGAAQAAGMVPPPPVQPPPGPNAPQTVATGKP